MSVGPASPLGPGNLVGCRSHRTGNPEGKTVWEVWKLGSPRKILMLYRKRKGGIPISICMFL